jgi:hypothetical protein
MSADDDTRTLPTPPSCSLLVSVTITHTAVVADDEGVDELDIVAESDERVLLIYNSEARVGERSA